MPRPNPRNRNAEVDFKGEKRSNKTRASVTDPEARLYQAAEKSGRQDSVRQESGNPP